MGSEGWTLSGEEIAGGGSGEAHAGPKVFPRSFCNSRSLRRVFSWLLGRRHVYREMGARPREISRVAADFGPLDLAPLARAVSDFNLLGIVASSPILNLIPAPGVRGGRSAYIAQYMSDKNILQTSLPMSFMADKCRNTLSGLVN